MLVITPRQIKAANKTIEKFRRDFEQRLEHAGFNVDDPKLYKLLCDKHLAAKDNMLGRIINANQESA